MGVGARGYPLTETRSPLLPPSPPVSNAHTNPLRVSGIEHADKGSGGPCAGASSITRPRSPGVVGQAALVLLFSQPSRVLTWRYRGPFGRGSSREACGPMLGSLVSAGCVRRAQPCRRLLRMKTCNVLYPQPARTSRYTTLRLNIKRKLHQHQLQVPTSRSRSPTPSICNINLLYRITGNGFRGGLF